MRKHVTHHPDPPRAGAKRRRGIRARPVSTSAAFWIRYGLVYGRLLAHAGGTGRQMEEIAADLENSWRRGERLAARALRYGYAWQFARSHPQRPRTGRLEPRP